MYILGSKKKSQLLLLFFLFNSFYYKNLTLCICICACQAMNGEVKGQLLELVLFFFPGGPGNQTRVVRLGSRCLNTRAILPAFGLTNIASFNTVLLFSLPSPLSSLLFSPWSGLVPPSLPQSPKCIMAHPGPLVFCPRLTAHSCVSPSLSDLRS